MISTFRSFSWHPEFRSFTPRGSRGTSAHAIRIFLDDSLDTPTEVNQNPALPTLMRPSITPSWSCRNLDLLSIEYASRPPLRSRLSLGGRPFPRNPCSYGGRDSHPSYRYSYRHPHFRSLQPPFRWTFAVHGTLPYQKSVRINPQLRYIA